MARASVYLNFNGNTEEVFNYYKSIFGGEFNGGVMRFGDMPAMEGQPPLSEEDKNGVMHISLPLFDGAFSLMGTDAPESMGFKVVKGNNVHINLDVASREEADKYFNALSENGVVTMPMADMFWGAYYGSCTDKFGIQWMFNHSTN